jgi:hypothetical protein
MSQLLSLRCNCDRAVAQAVRLLHENNLKVCGSFDLRSAANTPVECSCPHHGADPCACNLVVLLVYEPEGRPATLIFHGYDGQTWIALDVTPEQRPSVGLEQAIRKVLTADAFSRMRRQHSFDALNLK